MTFSTQYKRLFQVNILHLYFLNKGETDFLTMGESDKEKQLDFYNYQNFMRVQPTLDTIKLMNGHQMVFNNHNKGFSVWIKVTESDDKKPVIDLSDDLSLNFTVKIDDYRFFNYSNLDVENTNHFFYFSNRRLSTENNVFPLINLTEDYTNIDASFIPTNDGESLVKKGLLSGEQSNLFGIISIFNKADKNQLNVTTGSGKIPQNSKIFELYFENRNTYWRYIFPTDQTVSGGDDVKVENSDKRVLVTKKKYPLTQRGFVEVQLNEVELPNPDIQQIKPDASTNKIYSEIYM